MTFSIIIVSWNVRDKLHENLRSIKASVGVEHEIIVVDNASADGTAEMVRSEFPDARLIANEDNRGFAKACNQGLKVGSGQYLILLNPDMRLFPDTLADLKGWLDENSQADVSGVKLVDDQGEIVSHVRRFPRLSDQLGIVLKFPHIFPHILDSYLRSNFDYDKAAQVDSIRGAFFVISRPALEKFGYLDERYFLWFEEVDYCMTVWKKGGEVWYTPAASAVDYIGQSFNQVSRARKQSYFRASMIAYFKKWHPWWQAEFLALAWKVSGFLVMIGEKLNINSKTRT